MPNYDYKCTDCGKVFTQNRPIKDMEKVKSCEDRTCAGNLVKQITVGSVIRARNVPN